MEKLIVMIREYYHFEEENSDEIIDNIIKATQISSNSVETLIVSFPKVAESANAMSISLEQVLRDLGVIYDYIRDPLWAGTSLKKIYSKLAMSGQSLNEVLLEINTSLDKESKALDLFGIRATIPAIALAEKTIRID